MFSTRRDDVASERTPQQWFNPAAFAIVAATDPVTGLPRFGNAGRNIIVGPGTNYMDANLAKAFRTASVPARSTVLPSTTAPAAELFPSTPSVPALNTVMSSPAIFSAQANANC